MNKTIRKLIGNTPLIKTIYYGQIVYIKLEMFNLTGSIKDRMALYIIEQARKNKQLNTGSTIIEATTGNTGISLAALSNIYGYRMIAVMPEDQTVERSKIMKSYGAKLILTTKEKGPKGSIDLRDKLLTKIPNSWTTDQFANIDNIKAHELTGVEIANQLTAPVDYFIHGVGTGGTLMGVSKILKKKFPHIKIIAVEPKESAILSGGIPGKHNIQGIGEGFIPKLVDKKQIDRIITISTEEAIASAKEIALKTGIFPGFSSGANLAAIRKMKGRNKKILTVFADGVNRYLSQL